SHKNRAGRQSICRGGHFVTACDGCGYLALLRIALVELAENQGDSEDKCVPGVERIEVSDLAHSFQAVANGIGMDIQLPGARFDGSAGVEIGPKGGLDRGIRPS